MNFLNFPSFYYFHHRHYFLFISLFWSFWSFSPSLPQSSSPPCHPTFGPTLIFTSPSLFIHWSHHNYPSLSQDLEASPKTPWQRIMKIVRGWLVRRKGKERMIRERWERTRLSWISIFLRRKLLGWFGGGLGEIGGWFKVSRGMGLTGFGKVGYVL